jgi:succinate-semialdehyde dehydrogenase/glutarate-semialdehyde dehydrogenase
VVSGIAPDNVLMRQETFGPVAPVCSVDSFDEALDLMEADDLGLSASVMTSDRSRAMRAARRLKVGTVKIGAAFGGAPGGAADPRRGSGHGLGYGPELLDALTVVKVIHDAGSRVPHR